MREYSTSSIIKSYPSGCLVGRRENFIGLGTMNYAGIGYVYSPDCWSFNLQAYTVKWSVPRRESAIGIVRAVDISRQRKIRLKTHLPPLLLHSFFSSSSSNYRGFVSYDIIPNWGWMDFGVRSHTDFPLHKTKTLR